MKRVLWELLLRSIRGRLRRWLRLMRQPKYLVGTLIGVAWIGWWAGPMLFQGRVRVSFREGAAAFLPIESLHGIVALGLALVLSVVWLIPWGRPTLRLNEAEAHLLLPAPLARRHVIHYSLLKGQPGILVGCSIMTLVFFSGPFPGRLLHFPILWLLFTLWDVHMNGRSLWLIRLREISKNAARRRRLLLALGIAGFWLLALGGLGSLVEEIVFTATGSNQAPKGLLREVLITSHQEINNGILSLLLAPFLWVLAPVFTVASGATRALAALPAAALLVLQHEWVVRFRTRFEEAALERSKREAQHRAPERRFRSLSLQARRGQAFHLAATGRPEVGLLWKNLMLIRRMHLARQTVLVLLFCIAVAVIPAATGLPLVPSFASALGLGLAGYFTFLSGFFWRCDFRTDLKYAEVVRPWPLSGNRLAAGEILAPALLACVHTAFGLALFVAGHFGIRLHTALGDGFSEVGVLPAELAATLGVPDLVLPFLMVAGIMPLAAAIAAVSSGVQNIAVLLFPSWMIIGQQRRKGPASFGHNLLIFWALFLCLAVGLLPAALVVLAALLLHWLAGIGFVGWELPLLGLLAAIPLALEALVLIRIAGRLWMRLDLSAEVLSGDDA